MISYDNRRITLIPQIIHISPIFIITWAIFQTNIIVYTSNINVVINNFDIFKYYSHSQTRGTARTIRLYRFFMIFSQFYFAENSDIHDSFTAVTRMHTNICWKSL